jgi:hypothetical protein
MDAKQPPAQDNPEARAVLPSQAGPIRHYNTTSTGTVPYPTRDTSISIPTLTQNGAIHPGSISTFAGQDTQFSGFRALTTTQLTKLKEQFTKLDAEVDLLTEVCMKIYGTVPSRDLLSTVVAQAVDNKREPQNFSALTDAHYEILCPGEAGEIHVNATLSERVHPRLIPDEFWTCLQVIRATNSRNMGAGVRQIIGHFLSYAVFIARGIFQDNRLCVQDQYRVAATDIPGIGRVHGTLDFVTGHAVGQLPMGNISNRYRR